MSSGGSEAQQNNAKVIFVKGRRPSVVHKKLDQAQIYSTLVVTLLHNCSPHPTRLVSAPNTTRR